jgi:GxxExxY protein
MEVDFRLEDIRYDSEKVVEVKYKEHCVGRGAADLVVWSETERIVVELKAVAAPFKQSDKQQTTIYMDVLNVKQGLLINFWRQGENDKEPQFLDLPEPPDTKLTTTNVILE